MPGRRERQENRERRWSCEEDDCSFIRHYFVIRESKWAPALPGQRDVSLQANIDTMDTVQRNIVFTPL